MMDIIWYEKYRPKKLNDLVLPKHHKRLLRKYIKQKEIPHLLFYGPAGSGKSTIARILIDKCASSSLILNASAEDRGVATIKRRVKQFASAKRINEEKKNIVFFDEANGLTADAQEALKNPIEHYHKNCRFIFTTNEFDKITPPITSRCILFKFDSYPKNLLKIHLQRVLQNELVKSKDKDLDKIVDRFYPDVRTIMNVLEACSVTGVLKPENILTVVDFDSLKKFIKKGKITDIRYMFSGATDFLFVYRWLFNEYIYNLPEDIRSEAALTVAEYLHRDNTIVDKEINISACCMELMNLMEIDIDFKKSV